MPSALLTNMLIHSVLTTCQSTLPLSPPHKVGNGGTERLNWYLNSAKCSTGGPVKQEIGLVMLTFKLVARNHLMQSSSELMLSAWVISSGWKISLD